MADDVKKYVDLTGLGEFLSKLKQAYSGNTADGSTFTVGQAGKLSTARTIGLSGDVSGTATSFDGSQNITISTTIADVVASESGVGGSHGLMTAAQAEKLAGIATGAQVNVLEGVSFKGSGESSYSDLTISGKKAQLDLSGYALKTDIAAALNFKGTATGAELKAKTASTVSNGDVWSCTEDDLTGAFKFHAGYEYAATLSGSPAVLTWVELGNYIDLSGYVLKTQEINGKALSSDITLAGSDIALTGYEVASAASAVAATDTVNQAVGKLEYKINILNGSDSTTGSVAKSIKDAIEGLDVSAVGGSGKMLTTISEADGKISATSVDLVTTIGSEPSSTVPATAAAVKNYADGLIAGLDVTEISGDYITAVSEADGKISATAGTKGSVASGVTALVDGGSVYSAIEAAKTDTALTITSGDNGTFTYQIGSGSASTVSVLTTATTSEVDALFS